MDDSYDNALAETTNGLYKAVVIRHRSWPRMEAVELATLAWVGLVQPSMRAFVDRLPNTCSGGGTLNHRARGVAA